MPPRRRSREELEAENAFLRNRRAIDGSASVLNALFRWGGLSVISGFGYLSIAALAGLDTNANIAVSVFHDFAKSGGGLPWWLLLPPWLLAGFGILYGLAQRRLRRNTTERLQGRILELEKRLDPDRTSSMLTPRGETREEDRS